MSPAALRAMVIVTAIASLLPAPLAAGWTIQATNPATTGVAQIGQNTAIYGWGYATPSSTGVWAFGTWNAGAGVFTSEGQNNVVAVNHWYYGWMWDDTVSPWVLWTLSPVLPYGIKKPDHIGRASGTSGGVPWQADTLTFVVVP